MFSQFDRTFRSRCGIYSTVPHRGSLFYPWINYMAQLPSDAISHWGNARFAFAFAFAFTCVFRSASRPTYCAYICVPTNELGDPRSEPGNWNVRIKLAAHPSVVVCLYRSSSYPCLSFSLVLPFATAILFACNRDKRFRIKRTHRSLNRSFN